MLASWKKSLTNLDSILKSKGITLPTKVCLVKAMVFPVVMYGCEKESWEPKNWYFLKTLESPLDCKEMQPVSPKGNQSGIFIERTDADAETPILWPSDAKNWPIGKDMGLQSGTRLSDWTELYCVNPTTLKHFLRAFKNMICFRLAIMKSSESHSVLFNFFP